MADKAVSRLGFNRCPWCFYTTFGRHLCVEFIGLAVHLVYTVLLPTVDRKWTWLIQKLCTDKKITPNHPITPNRAANWNLWPNLIELLCKGKEMMPQVLLCTQISPHETPNRRQILMYSTKLGSVPEMKCVTKCHQNPIYISKDYVLNALLHPNSNP